MMLKQMYPHLLQGPPNSSTPLLQTIYYWKYSLDFPITGLQSNAAPLQALALSDLDPKFVRKFIQQYNPNSFIHSQANPNCIFLYEFSCKDLPPRPGASFN
ncbi:hypothetical protein L484_000667 [Morus notabilis]|uniref:Uncharacterized protein n=1 Tax=Morus notabilis TaxID=981085 RepID=W9R7F7_9ROSA|nr:hypothetical protein L484_000667 [Morus notabilis]